jgi:hypothetical protein
VPFFAAAAIAQVPSIKAVIIMPDVNVLQQPWALNLTFQCAGLPQWLYFGSVCRCWAALHGAVPTFGKQTSLLSVVESLPRFRYACCCCPTLAKDQLLPLSEAAAFSGSPSKIRQQLV